MRESVAIQSTDLCPNLNGHNGDSDDPTQVFPLQAPQSTFQLPDSEGSTSGPLLMSRAIKKCAFVFVRSLNELELLTRNPRSFFRGIRRRGRNDFVSLSSHLELGDKTNLFSLFITLCRYRFRFRLLCSNGHLRLFPYSQPEYWVEHTNFGRSSS